MLEANKDKDKHYKDFRCEQQNTKLKQARVDNWMTTENKRNGA